MSATDTSEYLTCPTHCTLATQLLARGIMINCAGRPKRAEVLSPSINGGVLRMPSSHVECSSPTEANALIAAHDQARAKAIAEAVINASNIEIEEN